MQSKTSFFNRTVFKKNLTRFAPVWVVYGLLLCVYFLMQGSQWDSEYGRRLGFVYSMASGLMEFSAFMNIGYGLLAAQLLFGDLYSSRMCNALHAMPLRRETWLGTNLISGLFFSAVPTLVAAVVMLPMLLGSAFGNGWTLAFWWWVGANLQFLCCFGLAIFAAMCVGTRLTMIAGYGLLQFGASLAWWLVDTLYTPMLYGVITPTTLMNNLTPVIQMADTDFFDFGRRVYEYELIQSGQSLAQISLTLGLTNQWWRLIACAAVGLVFTALALVLYRKRNLECAGDAVAFSVLKPVFLVLCTLFVICGGQFLMSYIFGSSDFSMAILALSVALGWFIGKMLLERTTRVFRKENWKGLIALSAVLALTFAATHFDVLNIEGRLPDREDIVSVQFDGSQSPRQDYTEPEDIDAILRIHALAVADKVEEQGLYIINADGSRSQYSSDMERVAVDYNNIKVTGEKGNKLGYGEFVRSDYVNITYELKNGSVMRRRFPIWVDGETGQLARSLMSDWELLDREATDLGGETYKVLDKVMESFFEMQSAYSESYYTQDIELAKSFIEAVKLDCEAGNMIQDSNFHRGVFYRQEEDRYGEKFDNYTEQIYVNLLGRSVGWDVCVYPDCTYTVAWLLEHDMLGFEVIPDAMVLPG